MVGRGLFMGWRRREQSFGVGGEVLAAVGGIEAFWEDDQLRALLGGFEDAIAGVREIGGFVGAW